MRNSNKTLEIQEFSKYKKCPYSPIATPSHRSKVQKQGKLKNRKPILQTKAQK